MFIFIFYKRFINAKSWVRVKLIIMILGSPCTIAQHIMTAKHLTTIFVWPSTIASLKNTDYNEVLLRVVLC